MKWAIAWSVLILAGGGGWLAVEVLGAPGLLLYGEAVLALVALTCRAWWSPPPPLPPSPLGARAGRSTRRQTGRFRMYDTARSQLTSATSDARYFDRVLRPELLRLAKAKADAGRPDLVDHIDRMLAAIPSRPPTGSRRRRRRGGSGPTVAELDSVIRRIEHL